VVAVGGCRDECDGGWCWWVRCCSMVVACGYWWVSYSGGSVGEPREVKRGKAKM
jgi:hypothetical protein